MGLRARYDAARMDVRRERDEDSLTECRRLMERIERHYERGQPMRPEDDRAHAELAYDEYRLLERLGEHDTIRDRLNGDDTR